jgi:hypothetical protein
MWQGRWGSAGSERIGVSFEVFVLRFQERIYSSRTTMNSCILLICLCVTSVIAVGMYEVVEY